MNHAEMRRLFLSTFIGFLLLTALVAIVSVLMGEFGEIQAKILATCLMISAASIGSMACAAFMERRQGNLLGGLGIACSIAAASLAILGMWPEIENEVYWKTTGSLTVLAAALAHAFLLTLPELDRQHRWIQTVSSLSIALLALQILIALWGEIDAEDYFRLLAVTAILVGLETLVIPILMRFRRGERSRSRQLVLRSVEGELYVDDSGRKYQVTEIPPQ